MHQMWDGKQAVDFGQAKGKSFSFRALRWLSKYPKTFAILLALAALVTTIAADHKWDG